MTSLSQTRTRVASISLQKMLGVMLFMSGGSALTYQVTWQRILSLFYGVGPVSTAIVVSVFMFGLGMGGGFAGWVSRRTSIGLRTYLSLEIGIGLFGAFSIPMLRILGEWTAGADLWLVAVSSFVFLCVPTMLMGATLPIVIQIFSRVETRLLSNLAFFYFVNTMGAAVGAFVSAFLIITFLGLDGATYVAAAINIALGGCIFLVPNTSPVAIAAPLAESNLNRPSRQWSMLGLIFLTGFLAIGYQIIWFRISGVLLKDSPYAFASILGVYLLGIAAGSRWIQLWRSPYAEADKKAFFFLLNALIAMSVAASIAVYFVVVHLPGLRSAVTSFAEHMVLPVVPGMAGMPTVFQSIMSFVAILLWPAFFMIVPTFLMGASFPLATSLLPQANAARTVGTAYFVAVVGNSLGGLLTGFVILPWLGTDRALSVFVTIGLLFTFGASRNQTVLRTLRAASVVILIGLVGWMSIPEGAFYSSMHASFGQPSVEHFEEGIEGVVLARRVPPYIFNFINGSSHGAYPGAGYFNATYAAAAHAPTAKSILVIGFGAGSVTEAALTVPFVDRVHMIEVNGTLIRNLLKFDEPRAILQNTRLQTTIDDARRELIRDPRRYDVVLMDPLRSTTQFSNNIYSVEFMELVKSRLNSGGVLMIWSDSATVLPRTVAEAFPYVAFHREHCSFMLASMQKLTFHPDVYSSLVSSAPSSVRDAIRQSLCLRNSENRETILSRTAGVPINRDYQPVAEYYLRGYR
jgi:spermidine synthase